MALYGRPLKVAVLCTVWFGSSSVNNIISKKLMRQHPYPITITLAQMMANSILFIPILMMAGIEHQMRQVPRKMLLKLLLPLAVGAVILRMTSLISLRSLSVSYTHTVKASMPIFTVFLTKILFLERYSVLVYLSLLPIFLGVSIATVTELNFELTGMLNAFVATLILAVLNVCNKKVIGQLNINPLYMLGIMATISFIVCLPVWVIFDLPRLQSDDRLVHFSDIKYLIGMLALSGFVNFSQSVTSFLVLHLLSPLSYSVSNTAKRIFVIAASIMTLKNPVTLLNVVGMMTAIAGVFLYNLAKEYQNKQTRDVLLVKNHKEDFIV